MNKQNRSLKFKELRKEFKEFTYDSYNYSIDSKSLKIEFAFKVDNFVEFHPKIEIPKQAFIDFNRISTTMMNQLVFSIGMVELISYWKAICPKKVIIKPFNLDTNQINFWKKIYFHGLGEFFYLNEIEIDMDEFMEILPNSNLRMMHTETIAVDNSALIPVGGGKDSVVNLEILKGIGDNLALIMNPRGASTATANIGGYKGRTFIIKRYLDSKLLDLNEQGYLNGHTPFSALLAFVSFLAAAVTGKKYIALSNESSANESTVVGTMVNHQYSKSLEFETDFRNYTQEYLSTDIQYFSLLRPLSELQIASIFAKNSDYFKEFRSCNVGSKINIWCGKCSKCLFTFIILSPFVSPKTLEEIFGSNLLDDKELIVYFNELTGKSDVKPFECVGTIDEVNAALCLALENYKDELPYLLKQFKKDNNENCTQINKEALLKNMEEEHYVEDGFYKLLLDKLQS